MVWKIGVAYNTGVIIKGVIHTNLFGNTPKYTDIYSTIWYPPTFPSSRLLVINKYNKLMCIQQTVQTMMIPLHNVKQQGSVWTMV